MTSVLPRNCHVNIEPGLSCMSVTALYQVLCSVESLQPKVVGRRNVTVTCKKKWFIEKLRVIVIVMCYLTTILQLHILYSIEW